MIRGRHRLLLINRGEPNPTPLLLSPLLPNSFSNPNPNSEFSSYNLKKNNLFPPQSNPFYSSNSLPCAARFLLCFIVSAPSSSMAMTTMHGERGEEVLPYVPAGVRFTPTDIELMFYLRSRVAAASSPFPRFLFQEADVYATEPWNLPNDSFRFQSVEKDMHFFTPRHPTSTTSQRARRTVGRGVWQGVGKDNHIMNRSQLIGHKTELHFVIFKGKDKKEKINTGWIMHEFRLHYSSSNEANYDDLVLCRIHLKKNSNSSDKGLEENAFAGSVADPGAVSFTQQQEEEEAEGRLVKRRRLEEDGLMADSNIETGIYGINIYTDQSVGQPAAPLSSSLPNMPSFIPLEEPRELASTALEVVSVADSDAISITQQQEDADADSDFALSLEQLLEEDVEEEADAEEEAVGRQLTKRPRLEENGLMADSNYEIQTYGINICTDSSGHPAQLLSSSLPHGVQE